MASDHPLTTYIQEARQQGMSNLEISQTLAVSIGAPKTSSPSCSIAPMRIRPKRQ